MPIFKKRGGSEMAGRMAGPQLSAYEQLVKEADNIRGKIDRYVLTLPKDGRGSFTLLPNTNKSQDWAFFKARLYQYRFLMGE